MGNERVHTVVNLGIALPALILLALFVLELPIPLIITFSAVFAYGTLFMNPATGQGGKVKLLSIRGILGLPFVSYAKVFRPQIAQSFLFGTLSRVIWLGLHVLLILYAVYRISFGDRTFSHFVTQYQSHLIVGFIGLFIADCLYLFLDRLLAKSKSRA